MSCLGEKTKNLFIKIMLLDDTEQQFEIKSSCKGQMVLDRVLNHLNLLEKDYFGLRYLDSTNQTHWLDVTKSIGSQLKGQQSCLFYFGVKFYAADPTKLHEEITRYQFFLQVKKDILQGRLPVNFDLATELCGLAVQSELGDYDPKRHTYGYVSEFRLVPHQTEELEDNIADLHSTLIGLVPAVAEYKFLDKVKWLDMYGVDLHPVVGDGNMEYFLGLTPTGIVVYKNQNKVGNYFWPRITKITFKGKMFTIRVRDKNNDEHSYGFSTNSKDGCKHLWKCCLEHHAFFRGRTERQLLTDSQRREPPHVHRAPSKRYERRNYPDVIAPDAVPAVHSQTAVTVNTAVPVHADQVQIENIPPSEASRKTSSAPWTDDGNKGLYTSGRDSPMSVRSEKMKFPGPRRAPSGSDSEAVYRRKHQSRRGVVSDCDSDTSYSKRNHRRRRSRGVESGSESECGVRNNRHRRRGKSNENMAPDPQWLPQDGVLKELRSNGSLNSNANSESSQKRRRRRSRSPGNKKPPEELAQHFKYVEPSGFTEDQLKEIPYTSVETNVEPIKVKYSPHSRHRHRSPRRRSYGEPSDGGSTRYDGGSTHFLPQEEAPPPYSADSLNVRSVTMVTQNRRSYPKISDVYRKPEEMFVTASPSSHTQETQVAPIVVTKENAAYPPSRTGTGSGVYSHIDHADKSALWSAGGHSAGGHSHDDSGVGVEQENARFDGFSQGIAAYNPHDSALPDGNFCPLPNPNECGSRTAFSRVVPGKANDRIPVDPAFTATQPVPSFRYITTPQYTQPYSQQASSSMSFAVHQGGVADTWARPSSAAYFNHLDTTRSLHAASVAPPHRDMMTEL